MLFKRISRSDPERVFIVCKNGWTTATLTNGQVVGWDLGDADGVTVSKIGAGAQKRMASFAGVVAESIPAGEYGLLQVYGYHSAVRVDCSTTGKNIYTGAPLFARVNAFNLKNQLVTSGAGIEEIPVEHRIAAIALEGYTMVGTTGTIKAIIYAL